jgi:hypothetical protein
VCCDDDDSSVYLNQTQATILNPIQSIKKHDAKAFAFLSLPSITQVKGTFGLYICFALPAENHGCLR